MLRFLKTIIPSEQSQAPLRRIREFGSQSHENTDIYEVKQVRGTVVGMHAWGKELPISPSQAVVRVTHAADRKPADEVCVVVEGPVNSWTSDIFGRPAHLVDRPGYSLFKQIAVPMSPTSEASYQDGLWKVEHKCKGDTGFGEPLEFSLVMNARGDENFRNLSEISLYDKDVNLATKKVVHKTEATFFLRRVPEDAASALSSKT